MRVSFDKQFFAIYGKYAEFSKTVKRFVWKPIWKMDFFRGLGTLCVAPPCRFFDYYFVYWPNYLHIIMNIDITCTDEAIWLCINIFANFKCCVIFVQLLVTLITYRPFGSVIFDIKKCSKQTSRKKTFVFVFCEEIP